jgi:hypothetical protein
MGYGAQMSAFGGNSFEQLSVCFAPGWANSFGRTHRPRPGLRLLHTQEPGAGSRPTPSGCCGVHGEAEGEQICRGEIHLISQSHTESVPRKPAPRRDRGQRRDRCPAAGIQYLGKDGGLGRQDQSGRKNPRLLGRHLRAAITVCSACSCHEKGLHSTRDRRPCEQSPSAAPGPHACAAAVLGRCAGW